jgi:3-phenylpropionate/trans-cinnamate dioxygenase ferredoxin reductase component
MTSTNPGAALAPDATVAIVGASLAGLRTLTTLRAQGFAGRIILIGAESHLPYDRPPLSKQVLAGKWDADRVQLSSPDKLGELGVELVLGHQAVGLDPVARSIELDDGSTILADALVVATGASPRHLVGTEGLAGVTVLRTLEDCALLRSTLEVAGSAARVVVVGAGFIGSEVASTCAGLGCEVVVLEALDTPLAGPLGEQMGQVCAGLHAEGGVELRTGVGVGEIRIGAGSDPLIVELVSGELLGADAVVVGVGVTPAVEWLESSGLTLDNGVVCDRSLFAADGVVAAGDVARWQWQHDGREDLVRIEHWQVAADGGTGAAHALLAGRSAAAPFTPVPYFWSDQYGAKIQMLGHPSPRDEVVLVEGSFEDRRFVALYANEGRLTGVLGISRPRHVMAFRPLMQEGASLDDARSVVLS